MLVSYWLILEKLHAIMLFVAEMWNMGKLRMFGGNLSSIVTMHVVISLVYMTFISMLTTLLLVIVHIKW